MRRPSASYVRKILRYNRRTGVWTWLKPNAKFLKRGDIAGANSHGYIRIKIKCRQHAAHRLAWLYITGKWPTKRLDHKDNNPSNNSWKNLRLATHSQNLANARHHKDSVCSFKGVTKMRTDFMAQIVVRGKHFYLGRYKTQEEAHAAYCGAAKIHFGKFARTK